MECKVLSDGDKLKIIRIKYNLKQDELSGKDITRNLISEIETGTANITKKTAEVVIKNLKKIGIKKHFKVTETVEYLMENQIVQATKVLDNYVEELKTLQISKDGSFVEILREAESFLIDWDIREKKLKIYELAGDYFCNNNEMCQSAVYYEKASALLSKMFLDKELLPLLRKLSIVYGRMGNYEKSIECCEFALSCFQYMSQEDKVIFRYNNALAYKLINNLELALKNINIAENLVNRMDISMYIKILNNKAVCLCKMKLYEEALELFNQILNLTSKGEVERYLINLVNITNIYMDINKKDKVVEYLNIIVKQLLNLSDTSLCVGDIYFNVGNMYKQLGDLELVEDYYLKALDFSEKQKNYVLSNKILNNLVDMYISGHNVNKMNNIKERLFFIAIKQNKIDNVLMYKLIGFYDKIGSGTCTEIADFALKFK